ncbi:MAG: UbiA family prenyltransferase [Thermoproteota archaeon]
MSGKVSKLKAYLKLSRPFTLLAPIFGGLVFSYLGYLEVGGPRCRILLTPLILALVNYTSNVINQIYDRDIDKVNKPYRPIPSGEVSVDGALSLAILLTIIVIGVSYFVNNLFGLLLSIIMVFAWMYSAPPLRLRSRLFWSNIALAAPRGALGILTAYASYANPFNNVPLLVFSLGVAVYVFGGNTFKDFPDEVGDRMFGVRNFVTVYGRRRAFRIAVISILLSSILFLYSMGVNIYTLPTLSILYTSFILFGLKNPELKTKTENTVMWTIFYVGMLALFILYLVSRYA